MTWGQLKQKAEQAGIEDDTEVVFIDDADDRWGVAGAELNGTGDEFQLMQGDEVEEE